VKDHSEQVDICSNWLCLEEGMSLEADRVAREVGIFCARPYRSVDDSRKVLHDALDRRFLANDSHSNRAKGATALGQQLAGHAQIPARGNTRTSTMSLPFNAFQS
jgi:hypothetical protein